MENSINKSGLHTAGGILFLIAAIVQLVFSVSSIASFFRQIFSYYATFLTTVPHTLTFIGSLAAAAGLAIIGLSLLTKNEKIQPLLKYAPLLVAISCAISVLTNIIYYFGWYDGFHIFLIIINIIYGLFWAVLAMIGFGVKPELTSKLGQGYIIVPAVLLAVNLLGGISEFTLVSVLSSVIEYAAVIILGIIVYTNLCRPEAESSHESNHAEAAPGASQHTAAPVSEPEGYIGVAKLIILSIVTLGIYVYIWIYRTAGYTCKRSAQGPQSSQGVQVVLCLFVPFYFIYWIYKQCKAIEDIRIRTTGAGGEDLALICLLLSIFGFGIVAYALMQDQLNKIIKPIPSPGYSAYAPPHQAGPTDEQIETLKKLKALLDAGILTQEEFDAKKKQVLDL